MADHILTTHVGSLPRPASLLHLLQAQVAGEAVDPAVVATNIASSVKDVVERQVSLGIDLVSDGEFSKPSYATYIVERLTGFGGETKGDAAADLRAFPEFAQQQVKIGAVVPRAGGACCQGPVSPKANDGLASDIANLKAAVEANQPTGAFINAASPGVVAVFQKNEFYPNEDAYIEAVAEALRPEYEAIVAAGFSVQLDSPDLAMSRHLTYADMDEQSFLKIVDRNVEALNHATRNIPSDRMRMHVCWGNYAGPHHFDIAFETIASRVLKARPQMILLEGANPRHGHDWSVFRNIPLPEDKILAPGVIDSTSNYVDHPELVAERLMRYADVVGRDRLAAGSDCGFSTFSGVPTVFPDIVWLKLKSLVEGAALASDRLWKGASSSRNIPVGA